VLCPICEKRKPARYCPAKGEKICAVCCGTEREMTVDCPSDCPYLISAHRYENEHERSVPAETPFLDSKLPQEIIYANQVLLSGISFTIAKFCAAQPSAGDPDILAALRALAETYKTLGAGIYYEKPPDPPLSRELYNALAAFLTEAKQPQAGRAGYATVKDSELFVLLVFLYRMGVLRTNGRPRSRRFIEFLRRQFPQAPELKREESRIIVP
jgi:hypothetical protein